MTAGPSQASPELILAGATPAAPASRRQWAGLWVLAAALGMIVLDGTIVAVALPAIIADLNLDLTQAQWVNSLYAVVFAALLLTAGRLGDRWGRRRMLLIGLVVFVLGSVLAALSGSAGTLLLATGGPGRRWRDGPAGDVVDGQRDLPGPGPGRRVRCVGRSHVRGRGPRTAARWGAHRGGQLATRLLGQRPDRGGRVRGGAPLGG